MNYSAQVLDHFFKPRNCGRMADADVVGRAGDPEKGGPFLLLFLKVEGDRIAQASFQTYGCAPAIAAGSLLAERLTGAEVAELPRWTADAIENALGGLPSSKRHCAAIAAKATDSAREQITRAPETGSGATAETSKMESGS